MDSKYGWLYNNPHKSDVKIVLTEVDVEPLNECSQRNRKPFSKELFGHIVVLESCSDCFRADNKENWKKKGMLGKPSLQLRMDKELFPVATEVIKYAYCEKLDDDLTTGQVMEVMKMAEKYRVLGLVDCCVARLATSSLDTWSKGQLMCLADMPPSLRSDPDFQELTNNVTRQLSLDYVDLEAAWRNDNLRTDFVCLPVDVVKLLFAEDETAVLSENLVLIAALTWLRGPRGMVTTDMQRSEVFSLLRLAGLTPTFASLLPRHVPEALAYLSSADMLKASFYLASSPEQRTTLTGEPYTSWSKPRKKSTIEPPSSLVNITVQELLTAVDECVAKKGVSVVQYKAEAKLQTDGFVITPAFQVQRPPGNDQFTSVNIWIGAAVDVVVRDKSLLPGSVGFTRPIQLTLQCGDHVKMIDEIYDAQHDWGRGYPAYFTIPDIHNPLQGLERFIVDGALSIKVTASNTRGL